MIPDRYEVWYANADGTVIDRAFGQTADRWLELPDDGVQVIAAQPGYGAPHLSPWSHVWEWRLWTGLDEYDPFGWGVKRGRLIPDEVYERVWKDVIDAYG